MQMSGWVELPHTIHDAGCYLFSIPTPYLTAP